jgi:hypothetical protein
VNNDSAETDYEDSLFRKHSTDTNTISFDTYVEQALRKDSKFGILRQMITNGSSDDVVIKQYFRAYEGGTKKGMLFMHSIAYPAILHWVRQLGRENIMVVSADDLEVKDRIRVRRTMAEIFRFLGLCPYEVPESVLSFGSFIGRNDVPPAAQMSQDMYRRLNVFFEPFNLKLMELISPQLLAQPTTIPAASSSSSSSTGRSRFGSVVGGISVGGGAGAGGPPIVIDPKTGSRTISRKWLRSHRMPSDAELAALNLTKAERLNITREIHDAAIALNDTSGTVVDIADREGFPAIVPVVSHNNGYFLNITGWSARAPPSTLPPLTPGTNATEPMSPMWFELDDDEEAKKKKKKGGIISHLLPER